MSRSRAPSPQPIHRWIIAALCTVLQLCLGTVYAWSFFQPLLVEQFRWSHTGTSWAFSLAICFLGLSAMGGGMTLPRLGPRKLAVAGGILFAVGYGIAAWALHRRSLVLFDIGYGCVAGTGIGLGYVTPMSTVTKWFPDKKGLMTGIVAMGFGLGAFIMSMILAPVLIRSFKGDLVMVFGVLGAILGGTATVCAAFLHNPPPGYVPEGFVPPAPKKGSGLSVQAEAAQKLDLPLKEYIVSGRFVMMWIVFFFNIAAGISIVSFQSPLFQEIWKAFDASLDRPTLAARGATLIAVSSLFNGFGRIFWGSVSDRFGRVDTFRILLATQMVVFGVLLTERDPWIFAILICYVLSCFGGGFAIMPSFVMDVYGTKRMSVIYGIVLTAWSAAGLAGPFLIAGLKDNYPDRAVIYAFLMGICFLGQGFTFSFLLADDPFLPKQILRMRFAVRRRRGFQVQGVRES